MKKGTKYKINSIHSIAQFALFVSSYFPLFFLLILKQLSENIEFLNWGGLNSISILTFILKFGLSTVLIIISIFGLFGLIKTLKNIEENIENGLPFVVLNVKNKNSESIGYIATYIIPFLFQSFSGWYELFSVLFLLLIIYPIYINSNLLLINPLLSIRYSIFEIEYTLISNDKNKKVKNGLVITRDKYLCDDLNVKLYEIGHKLYFAKVIEVN